MQSFASAGIVVLEKKLFFYIGQSETRMPSFSDHNEIKKIGKGRVKNIINTTPLSLRVLGNVCVDIYCSCTEFALWVLMVNFKNICIILWQRKPVPR
jgi:hypothetical protein